MAFRRRTRRRIKLAAVLTGCLTVLAAVVAGMLVLNERRTPPPVSEEIAAYVSQMPEAKIEVWKPAGKLGVIGDSFSLDDPSY